MAPPTRWGIASAGKISNDFCSALSTLEDHTCVAVAARNEASAREFAEIFGIPKFYGGYEKLAADPNIGEHLTILNEILNLQTFTTALRKYRWELLKCFLSPTLSDVVYIGAINTAHLDIGLMMLNAGKHVLCKNRLIITD